MLKLKDIQRTYADYDGLLKLTYAVNGLKNYKRPDNFFLQNKYQRLQAVKQIKIFLTTYLSRHFNLPFGEHHDDLIDCLTMPSPPGGKLVVRAEPREHGKSTLVLLGFTLFVLAWRLKQFIVLFGASRGGLWPHFNGLQAELDPETGNALLLKDFPHLRPATDFKGQLVKWADDEIEMEGGQTVMMRSIHGTYRGIKKRNRRPDLILVDDPQDDEHVATHFRRQKLVKRFRKTLLNLRSQDGDVFVEGNLQHRESLIGTLLVDPAWNAKLYRAENTPPKNEELFPIGNTKTDGSPLWPESWSMERLATKREEIKTPNYLIEYMNDDSSVEDQLYDSAQFQKFDVKTFELDDSYQVILIWDPSAKDERMSRDPDYAAMTVLASKVLASQSGMQRYFWVLAVWMQKANAEVQVEAALDLYEGWPVRKIVYEDNGGFITMMPYLKQRAKERGLNPQIKTRTQNKNKTQRLDSAQAVIKYRTFFASNLPKLYFVQWDELGRVPGAHDDGPDSTVSGIEQFINLKQAVFG